MRGQPIVKALAALLFALTGALAWANTTWVSEALPGAQKAGQGRLTWLGFKVYDAQLWVDSDFKPTNYAQEPFVLSLTYLRTLKGADIAKRSKDEIAKLGLGTEAQRMRWYEEMKRVFPDVKAGDALAGLHQPGKGVKFFSNGKAIAEVADPQFAQAFFAIWLDANTTVPALRDKLLGSKKGAGE
jgi:hypothetical protein